MLIDTTININTNLETCLLSASNQLGIAPSELIISLIKKLMANHHGLLAAQRRIRYQSRDKTVKRRRRHCVFLIRDYEYLLDMKKFCKRSVSLLIAIAISEHLENMLTELNSSEDNDLKYDNYQFQHYIIIRDLIDGVICWRIYWGLPKDHNILLS